MAFGEPLKRDWCINEKILEFDALTGLKVNKEKIKNIKMEEQKELSVKAMDNQLKKLMNNWFHI